MTNDEFQKLVLERFDKIDKEEQAKNLAKFKQTIKDSAFDLAKKIS